MWATSVNSKPLEAKRNVAWNGAHCSVKICNKDSHWSSCNVKWDNRLLMVLFFHGNLCVKIAILFKVKLRATYAPLVSHTINSCRQFTWRLSSRVQNTDLCCCHKMFRSMQITLAQTPRSDEHYSFLCCCSAILFGYKMIECAKCKMDFHRLHFRNQW